MLKKERSQCMIVKAPNKKLKTICLPCKFPEAKSIAKKLIAEYKVAHEEQKKNGMTVVGLAAPQIGITKCVFLALGEIFINPKIELISDAKIDTKEGCLSLKDKFIHERKRYKSIRVEWIDLSRKIRQEFFDYDAAVVIQHEYEHLLGKLCSD